MIDLEKEREEFIKVYTEIYGEHDEIWQGWKKRAELAQQEIDSLKILNIELQHSRQNLKVAMSDNDSLYFFLKKENEELKAKLAKYESRDVVVLPRIPSNEMVEAMGYAVCNMGGDCWFDTDEAYKAMIEAGEIK